MKLALATTRTGNMLICGMSLADVDFLKTEGMIVTDVESGEWIGTLVVTLADDEGVCKIPDDDNEFVVLSLKLPAIHTLVHSGKSILLRVEDKLFQGEIAIFVLEDDAAISARFAKMFAHAPSVDSTDKCSKCDELRREDGSCGCRETLN